MAPKAKFKDGEKVLCFHGPLIYEAKCLESMVTKTQVKYFIHYAGWNKNWDEWVPESRVMKYNEANLAKQEEIKKAHTNQTSKGKKNKIRQTDSVNEDTHSNTSVNETSHVDKPKPTSTANLNGPDSSSDLCHFSVMEIEDENLNKNKIKIKLPDELKPCLVDDWDLILRQRKLPNLPAKPTVDEIMDNYLVHNKKAKNSNSFRMIPAVTFSKAIKECFNIMLGAHLLYKFERPRYAEILQENPGVPMSKIYGAIYLLRLFVNLGYLLPYSAQDERDIQLTLNRIQDFFKYLIRNSSTMLNLQHYTSALPEYLRKAL